jgi:hypothetical protein
MKNELRERVQEIKEEADDELSHNELESRVIGMRFIYCPAILD